MNKLVLLFSLFFLQACSVKKNTIHTVGSAYTNITLDTIAMQTWQYKDIVKDSISGISLDRAYADLLKNKKGKGIIVAVIDTQMDINHEDLKQAIWVNANEIPNNGIDDDKNGYVDDVRGWNFIGNIKGESVLNLSFEYVRILKKYQSVFDKSENFDTITNKQVKEYVVYRKAKKKLDTMIKKIKYYHKSMDYSIKVYDSIETDLFQFFPNKKYTIAKLNSIKTENKRLQRNIRILKYGIKKNWSIASFNESKSYYKNLLETSYNTEYNDRVLIGDNEDDITNISYGGPNVNIMQSQLIYHATYIGGTLNANRHNGIGAMGVYDKIKIMPLSISGNGDENDKDIALAIRYAVDNGAQIINMSSSKEFTMHKNWVDDALLYAEKNNVLFVTAAANSGYNIDVNTVYTNDIDIDGKEFLTNFICVGATTLHANKKLVASFSNYGKENVDIFAPGKEIYTTNVNNEYEYKNGTSMATPIVSGIAALIWSHYPKLKAYEVKEILLASGVSYNFDVEVKAAGKKVLVPFSSLSKSGKIVNAYNALLLAKHYKKWKLGKWHF